MNDKVLKEYFSIEENKDKNQNTIISIEIKQPDFFNQWLKSLENKDKYTKRKEVYTIDKHGFLKSVKTYSTYIENGLVSDVDAQIKLNKLPQNIFPM